jgi:DNA-binding NarL/FixJ family response regulator
MKRIRILLADDHQVVRDGLKLLINNHPGMQVVGEAANGKEVLQQARQLKPDVVVMDLSMPELNGLQATERLVSELPQVRVVALTGHEDESYLNQLCKAGASGYLLKRSAGDELIHALGSVARGGVYFDPDLAARALARQLKSVASSREPSSADLSEREKEVLSLLAWGYSNKEIANQLKLSIKTIETYKARVSEKLQLRSRTELVRYALRKGWLSEERSTVPKPKPR